MGLEQVSDTSELEKIIDEALVGEEENITKFHAKNAYRDPQPPRVQCLRHGVRR